MMINEMLVMMIDELWMKEENANIAYRIGVTINNLFATDPYLIQINI